MQSRERSWYVFSLQIWARLVSVRSNRLSCTPNVLTVKQADLGRARQEELPLSTLEGRGPSFIRPRQDYSRKYDSGVKTALGSKWSSTVSYVQYCSTLWAAADEFLAKIVDEESEQMQGLANLSARPWAEGLHQQRWFQFVSL